MKKLYFTLTLIFVFLFSFSQSGLRIAQNSNNQNVGNRLELAQANSENELENSINRPELNQSPFEAVKGKKEDDSKRDAYSRHYINDDGSYTAIIGAGPMHYFNLNNGKWEDIKLDIVATTDPDHKFANITNVFESHFGTHLQNGIINKNCKTKAGAACLSGTAFIYPVKPLKDPVQLVCGNTDTGVFNRNNRMSVFNRNMNFHGSIFFIVPNCILEQVVDHFPYKNAVGIDSCRDSAAKQFDVFLRSHGNKIIYTFLRNS